MSAPLPALPHSPYNARTTSPTPLTLRDGSVKGGVYFQMVPNVEAATVYDWHNKVRRAPGPPGGTRNGGGRESLGWTTRGETENARFGFIFVFIKNENVSPTVLLTHRKNWVEYYDLAYDALGRLSMLVSSCFFNFSQCDKL